MGQLHRLLVNVLVYVTMLGTVQSLPGPSLEIHDGPQPVGKPRFCSGKGQHCYSYYARSIVSPTRWYSVCQSNRCFHGLNQSPIFITDNMAEQRCDMSGPSFQGDPSVSGSLVNNGIGPMVTDISGTAKLADVPGYPDTNFDLVKLHIHFRGGPSNAGTEHRVGNKVYDAEMHVISKREDLSMEQAVLTEGGLAVIAIFLSVAEGENSSEVDKILNLLRSIRKYKHLLCRDYFKVCHRVQGENSSTHFVPDEELCDTNEQQIDRAPYGDQSSYQTDDKGNGNRKTDKYDGESDSVEVYENIHTAHKNNTRDLTDIYNGRKDVDDDDDNDDDDDDDNSVDGDDDNDDNSAPDDDDDKVEDDDEEDDDDGENDDDDGENDDDDEETVDEDEDDDYVRDDADDNHDGEGPKKTSTSKDKNIGNKELHNIMFESNSEDLNGPEKEPKEHTIKVEDEDGSKKDDVGNILTDFCEMFHAKTNNDEMDILPKCPNENSECIDGDCKKIDIHFRPNGLLPDRRDFYSYYGSLTTPPLSEAIAWTIMTEPIRITEQQLSSMQRMESRKVGVKISRYGNVRPVQPLNGRKILSNMCREETVPNT